MAERTLNVSGVIKETNKKAKVYQVVISGMTKSTATFKLGGSDGAQVGPVIRAIENGTAECTFKGGLKCDYVMLTGTGVNCWLRYR